MLLALYFPSPLTAVAAVVHHENQGAPHRLSGPRPEQEAPRPNQTDRSIADRDVRRALREHLKRVKNELRPRVADGDFSSCPCNCLVPAWQIIKRTGHSGWWLLVMFQTRSR